MRKTFDALIAAAVVLYLLFASLGRLCLEAVRRLRRHPARAGAVEQRFRNLLWCLRAYGSPGSSGYFFIDPRDADAIELEARRLGLDLRVERRRGARSLLVVIGGGNGPERGTSTYDMGGFRGEIAVRGESDRGCRWISLDGTVRSNIPFES